VAVRQKSLTTFTTRELYLSSGGEVGVSLEIKTREDEEGLLHLVSIELYEEGRPSSRIGVPMEEVDELIGLLQEVREILTDLMTTGEVK